MTYYFGFMLIAVLLISCVCHADDSFQSGTDSPCIVALRRFPKPDTTYTAKHLFTSCPELCKNSSGHFPTGQFPHPWDCNAFINCYNDDAWVHWCQVGLDFNENNLQCDYPRNVNCKRSQPDQFTAPPAGLTTQSQWVFISTTPSPIPIAVHDRSDVQTCKDSISKLNDRELLGPRPDLCTAGSGNYRAPDCRFYVLCVGVRAYVARCPAGFVFDTAARQCDWPSKNPGCLKSCLDGGNYDNNDVSAATTQRPITTTLDANLRTENLTCNDSHCIPKAGCQPELCRQPRGQFEIKGNCSSFANCWDSCAYVTDCPSGMVFAEANGVCDDPWSLPKNHACYKDAGTDTSASLGNFGQDQDMFNMKQSQSMNGGSMTQTQS